MGKLSRVCSKLEYVYGPPGATLKPPRTAFNADSKDFTPTLLDAVKSWRYPAAVKRLLVEPPKPSCMAMTCNIDSMGCLTLAQALPNLETLRYSAIFRPSDGGSSHAVLSAIIPQTALVELNIQLAPSELRTISTFAPHLRSLAIAR
jgi:hypothetical protein